MLKWGKCRLNIKKELKRLEKIMKGVANHRRIQILELLEKQPELSLQEIPEILNINFNTASKHLRRLAIAGLVMKRSDGVSVRHKLTNRGLSILKFLRTLE